LLVLISPSIHLTLWEWQLKAEMGSQSVWPYHTARGYGD